MKRQLVESLERRKEMMIAALWANSGFEGKEGADARANAIQELEVHYDEAVESILSGRPVEEEFEIDKENPFFAAAERGQKRIAQPRDDEGSVKQALQPEDLKHLEIDQ